MVWQTCYLACQMMTDCYNCQVLVIPQNEYGILVITWDWVVSGTDSCVVTTVWLVTLDLSLSKVNNNHLPTSFLQNFEWVFQWPYLMYYSIMNDFLPACLLRKFWWWTVSLYLALYNATLHLNVHHTHHTTHTYQSSDSSLIRNTIQSWHLCPLDM